MPSSVKQIYAIASGVAFLALLGLVFAPHIFAAWTDAPNNPPTYGAIGCSPYPCLEDDFKPITQTDVSQAKLGKLAIGRSTPPTALGSSLEVTGNVDITGEYRINGVSLTQGGGSVLSGAGTANYIPKWTNGTALGNSSLFDNGTNVGIGISSGFNPLADNKLEVAGAVLGKAFFDQDNSAYYLDPASSGSGNIAGSLTMGGTLAAGNVTIGGSSVCRADGTNCPVAAQYWTLTGADIYSNNTGNVGIGTATPTAKLDVLGSAGTVGLKIRSGGNSGVNLVDIADINGAAPFVISPLGSVGIGTTAPLSTLSVGGMGSPGSGIYGSGGMSGIYGSGPNMGVYGEGGTYGVYGVGQVGIAGNGTLYGGYFTSSTGNGLVVMQGNVGIGTTGPTEKLVVNGNIRANDVCTTTGKCLGSSLMNSMRFLNGAAYNASITLSCPAGMYIRYIWPGYNWTGSIGYMWDVTASNMTSYTLVDINDGGGTNYMTILCTV